MRAASIDLKVAVAKFSADYDSNEIAADQKYKGKKILAAGRVESSIDKDFMGKGYLILRGHKSFHTVHALLKDESMGEAATLKKGSKVTLVCDGGTKVISFPSLAKCQFVDQYIEEIRPKINKAAVTFLKEPGDSGDLLALFYAAGTTIPADSSCFSEGADACLKEINGWGDGWATKKENVARIFKELRGKEVEEVFKK